MGVLLQEALQSRIAHELDGQCRNTVVPGSAPVAGNAAGLISHQFDVEHPARVAKAGRDRKSGFLIAISEYLAAPLNGEWAQVALPDQFLLVGVVCDIKMPDHS